MKRITIKSILLTLIVVSISIVDGQSQTKNAFIKAAEDAGAAHDHYSEMIHYKSVLEFDEDNLEFNYKTAEAARQINALTKAEGYYKRVIELDEENDYPLAPYYLATMQQKLGKYDTAQANYQIFLTEYDGEDAGLKARAEKEMSACEWAQDYVQTEWEEFQIEHLSSDINTPYTEFGATQLGDSLYYSSLRFDNKKDEYNPNRPLTGILVSKGLGTGEKLGEDINVDQRHTAHTAFNKTATRLYFTLCEYGLPDSIRCDLYYRDRTKKDSSWGVAIAVGNLNSPDYSTTQPNVAYNAETGEEHLYFVSNRPGGKGAFDIYRVEIKADGFGEPENMMDINTAEDEVTPFYHSSTQTLYFSSSGRKTLGGLDVFKTSMRGGSPGVIQHLGYPLNGSYHDLYFSLNDKGDVAYFSSNREGSFYLDEEIEACCYDIYKVDILPFANLIAQTMNGCTGDSLKGTDITLYNKITGESMTSMAADRASAKFPLARDMEYLLISTKAGFVIDTVSFNTVDVTSLDDIVKKQYIVTEELMLDVFAFSVKPNSANEALRGATVTLYDLADTDSDPIIETNLQSNDFHIPLERGTRYRLNVSRKGYTTHTSVINTSEYRDKCNVLRNVNLEIGDLGDFLPLVLFFDNDYPNPNTWLEKTDLEYTETYPDYYTKKQTFIDNFTAPLSGAEKTEESDELSSFFDTEVKKGNDDLLVFLEVLEAHLQKGDSVSIFLKGYASPRSHQAYNYALGSRRVSSVKNNFERYGEGRLQSYIDSGQLEIDQKSFGETTAPSGVSSSMSDERNSIYSYEASKERRVEIIQIDINK